MSVVEVTTEHGTRIILDITGGLRWMRIPVMSADGTLNLQPLDGRWRSLMWFYPLDLDAPDLGRSEMGTVRIGERLRIHIGMTDYWTTSRVTAVRNLAPDEVPQEVESTLDDA